MKKAIKRHIDDNGWAYEVVDSKGLKHGIYSQSVFYSKEEALEEVERRNNECQ
jgi:hypothetical protein